MRMPALHFLANRTTEGSHGAGSSPATASSRCTGLLMADMSAGGSARYH